MSDYLTVVEGIQGAIQGVVGNTVNVYAYQRMVVNLTDYIALFETTGATVKYHGWLVTLAPSRPMGPPLTGEFAGGQMGAIAREYSFVARGIYAVQDSANTESTFAQEVEAVMQALDARKNYGDASVVEYATRCWVEKFDMRQFGSPLCHYAELPVVVTVERAVTFA